MEFIRRISPFGCQDMLSCIREIFGEEEALLKTPQLNGTEVAVNTDIVYEAWENGVLCGTVHGTIPGISPRLCGISAVCTTPAHRGKGISKHLFRLLLEEMEQRGVEAFFLGTGNPVAAGMYASYGFSYLPGSGVMARFHGHNFDTFRKDYTVAPKNYEIIPGSAAMRIPMIPLIVCGGKQRVLDWNTALYNASIVSQLSCMSLYPKYEALQQQGGRYWGVLSDSGLLGAMLSVLPTPSGMRADFFCGAGFEGTIPELLQVCQQEVGPVYLQVADFDIRKQPLVASLGYAAKETCLERCGNFYLNAARYWKTE